MNKKEQEGLFDTSNNNQTAANKETKVIEKDPQGFPKTGFFNTGGSDISQNKTGVDEDGSVITVSEITTQIKMALEGKYRNVRVKGELSNFKKHVSGHCYFSLIENDNLLQCVAWRSVKIPEISDGMQIICEGKITAYTGRSQFQLVVSNITVAGKGNLAKLFEELKKKLSLEGLFDQNRKKPIPTFPKTIGIITAATGDAIKDILIRLKERIGCKVIVWSVQVQGVKSPQMIKEAIEGFNTQSLDNSEEKPDVIILARGGGSIEDLWAFNEEVTVRAISASAIPVISAIGHEADVTLADYVSDKRAPTPTASIEILLPTRMQLYDKISKLRQIVEMHGKKFLKTEKDIIDMINQTNSSLLENFYGNSAQKIETLSEKMASSFTNYINMERVKMPTLPSLDNLYDVYQNKLDNMKKRLNFKRMIDDSKDKLNQAKMMIENVSYEKVLERGFCMALNSDKNLVSNAAEAKKESNLNLMFSDGEVKVKV